MLTLLAAFPLFVPAASAATSSTETFSQYSEGVWQEGTTHGDWYVRYNGYGRVAVRKFSTGNKVLTLQPTNTPPDSSGTEAAMVTSVAQTSGDLILTARMRTRSQNAKRRNPPERPNEWEVAWLYWNLTYRPGAGDEGTGAPITETAHGYYLALKPTGWELGKLDQARFVGIGGQRYLATGTSRRFPIGRKWHRVRVQQSGATITVTVDGRRLTRFTDGPGSGGSPAWSEHPHQEVYTAGSVGLYTEDAHVEFDHVTRTTP